MGVPGILVWVVIGAVAGWLASILVRGGSLGLLGNIVVGIVGAVVAGWLLPTVGISLGSGILGAILAATVGAVIVLGAIRLFAK
ncbi:GlsB/YeaQ/YmgE family stress response membrane protein [Roseomonas alkaliterrae]|uniref:GlsB/YeaQ/YmgE family stress response membrane protein n=1 Tax=Neoroseomonas alkaliterrae TaxID=1452450 RepID=UPI0016118F80|nr:GlsB/YeaQ/YmgE family stress response membrane protein [Neoroseomonas alkaliterrae]MBR0677098.1 GlsB/YeaQ/YmgE family stress response membrane protein [Neoroseomonas alkaliterrae]